MLKSVSKIDEIEIKKIFEKPEFKNIKNLFIASDLGSLGIIKNKKYTLSLIHNLLNKVNKNINIVVPTANFNIINSNESFDFSKTPSFRMGAFSEYIRLQKDSIRSYHPIWSLSCVGPDTGKLFKNISNHAYDQNSSFSRLFDNDFYFLSFGKHPRFMLSIIHYLENINKVPYRFKKGFKVRILENNEVIEKEFFLDVLKDEYRQKPRARNKRIFETFENSFEVKYFMVGSGIISLFKLSDFALSTNKLMKKDLYCWFK